MKKTIGRTVLFLILILYALFLIYVLFLRYRTSVSALPLAERIKTDANFTPFKTIDNYIYALKHDIINENIVFENIVGNLLLFLPIGAILPSMSYKLDRAYKALSVILFIIALVEGVQLITGLGRFDIDDIILNFTGAVIGCMINYSIRNAAE